MKSADPLSCLLRAWQHRPLRDDAFCPCVWKRIRASESSSPSADILPFWQRLPVGWAALIAIGLASMVGSSAAFAYDSLTRKDRQVAAYFRSIDPVQKSVNHSTQAHK